MLVLSVFILFSGCALALADYREIKIENAADLFEKFIIDHNKNYKSQHEKQLRFKIFKENLQEINKYNRIYRENTMGINLFSDMSRKEFKKTYLGCTAPGESNCTKVRVNRHNLHRRAPENFDWRDHGVVTPIKDQAGCGACWAFSAIANIESQYALKHNKQLDLSEQQEVDCDKSSSACVAGFTDAAILNLINVGVMLEEDYPYTQAGGQCQFDPNKVQVKVTDCLDFSGADEETIKDILVNYGPLSIALGGKYMYQYKGTVLKCCDKDINHSLLVVGYGTDEQTKEPYWIIKNSWSENWGEKGYLRLLRGLPDCEFGQHRLVSSKVD